MVALLLFFIVFAFVVVIEGVGGVGGQAGGINYKPIGFGFGFLLDDDNKTHTMLLLQHHHHRRHRRHRHLVKHGRISCNNATSTSIFNSSLSRERC